MKHLKFLAGDISSALAAIIVVGLIGLWLGLFVSVIVLTGLVTIALRHRARAVPFVGKPTGHILQAEGLVLTDPQGKPRVCFDADGLQLMDAMSNPRATLAFHNDIPSLSLTDSDSKVRVMLGVNAAEPFLNFLDTEGQPSIGLRVQTDGGGSGFFLFDQNGKQRAAIATGSDGSTTLALKDSDEKTRAEFGLTIKDNEPLLRLYDKDRKLRTAVGVAPDGTSFVMILDQTGNVLGHIP